MGKFDGIMTLSEQERQEYLRKYGFSPDQVTANPAPYNTDIYAPHPGVTTDEKNPHVLAFGVSKRDYPTLVEAMRIIPDVEGIFNPYSPSDPLKDSSWMKDLPSNITIDPSPKTPETFRDSVLHSKAVVLAIEENVQQSEAGCTAAQAAGAMERPIIAATLGLKDYIKDGETGIIVPPRNPEALAKAINYLWLNPHIAREMGRKGREFMIKEHSPEAWVRRSEQIMNINGS